MSNKSVKGYAWSPILMSSGSKRRRPAIPVIRSHSVPAK